MEIALAAGTLKVAYHLLIVGIKVEQVPSAVRRCIELVRTCHRDLEDLIKLRNESLSMLESKPAILQRINTIIENAHHGLLEVARLVEKLRPEAHDGSSPLMSRLEWIFIDSREFSSQEPLISRQHSSVIAELNFLRQLILLAPLIDKSGANGGTDGRDGSRKKRSAIAWDNVGLLDEMMGARKQTVPQPAVPSTAAPVSTPATPPASPPAPTSSSSNFTTSQSASAYRVASPTPTLSDPPPPYSLPNPPSTATFPTAFPPTSTSTNAFVYNVAVPTPGAQATGSMGSLYPGQVKPSPESMNIKRTTTFDPEGISFLFGDLKVSPKPAAVSGINQPAQPNTASMSTNIHGSSLDWKPSIAPSPLPGMHPGPLQPQSSQFSSAHNSTAQSTYQPSPAQQVQSHSQHQPQLLTPPHTQPPPLPSNQEPAFKVKPLSTIPQDLIHRHDGVQSPPLNPLFSPLLGGTHLSTAPTLSTATVAAVPGQQQTWGHLAQEVQASSTYAPADCCSSCGSARNSLSGIPTGRSSTSSSLNIPQPIEALTYAPEASHGQLRPPSPARPQSWAQPISHPNPSYTSTSAHFTPPNIDTPAIKPATTYPGVYTPPQTEDAYIPRNTRARRAISSLDLTQPNTNRPTGVAAPGHSRGLFPQASFASFPSVTSSYSGPSIHRHSTPQPLATGQAGPIPQGMPHSRLRPVSSGGFVSQAPAVGGHDHHFNPSVQTFATIREHWEPETLIGTQQASPSHGGEVGVSTSYPSQPSHLGAADPFQPQYPQVGTTAALETVNTVPGGHSVGIAELYGSSVSVATETRYDGEPVRGIVHTEIHELSSVGFAPDPVELE